MIRRVSLGAVCGLLCLLPQIARGQQAAQIVPDSIAVLGIKRVTRQTVLSTSGFAVGRVTGYRDVQHALEALYASGQFQDVRVAADTSAGRSILLVTVKERPILIKWTVKGTEKISDRTVRERVTLFEGRPLDPAAVARSAARIDSLYRGDGYYLASVNPKWIYEADSSRVRVVFEIDEGRRVAIARVTFEGNHAFTAQNLVDQMSSKPEGFFFWRNGEYDEDKLQKDLTQKLPDFYGARGYVDFQVLGDTLIVDDTTGKATLVVRLSEGKPYRIGTFEIAGNRHFTTEEIQGLYPFSSSRRTGLLGLGGTEHGASYFNQTKWDDATNKVYTAYRDDGYLYVQIQNDVVRRVERDGTPVVDLRWFVQEHQPAIVNKIDIVGNDVTHESVIRDAIEMIPGDVFRQNALLASYQNISNLGFFQQPLPIPDTRPANDQGDVDVIFRVEEKRTGNVNFGASVGQGTGLGGFIGLDEPNLFGRGKRGHFQWQFGQNITDFDISYTDPAIMLSRISGTLDLHDSRYRYTIADLGQLRRRGGSLQFGFPLFDARKHVRLFLSYSLDDQSFIGSALNPAFGTTFGCSNCLRSTIGTSILRDTRVELPFPTGGSMTSIGVSQSGGVLGGTGNFQRVDIESHWYAPLGTLGGKGAGVNPPKFVLGLSTRSGFVFGKSPFFDQLFTMGGTQFGIPLRGYDEFSVTPRGYDPNAAGGQASANAFGNAFFLMNAEVGLRLSQAFYVSTFFDAGNVWARPAQFDPTRLFRGAGVGVAVVSPLGPIGLDLGYGFDKVNLAGQPAPGWKLHFKLGNFF
ncbi:MAG TPA: outer membrane protein assembly factor BamA [Gemmatimonadales bacterium]|nr:outer membrane protein assembly factor BamA [Gemmatimonadales bacterium]